MTLGILKSNSHSHGKKNRELLSEHNKDITAIGSQIYKYYRYILKGKWRAMSILYVGWFGRD